MREVEDFRAVFGDDFFVGGDDVLALGNGIADDLVSRVGAARHFDDDFKLRVIDEIERLIGDANRREIDFARFYFVAHGDPFDAKARVVLQQLDDACADGAESNHADAYFGH